MMRAHVFGLVALMALAGACQQKEKPKQAKPAVKKLPVTPKVVPVAYPELGQAVRLVAKGMGQGKCNSTNVSACPGYKEAAKLISARGKGKEELATLATLMNDADAQVATVAGFLSYDGRVRDIGQYFREVAKGEEKVDPKVADALISGVAKLDGYAANRAVTLAAWAASVTGKLEPFAKMIEGHRNRRIAGYGIAQMMAYGRLSAFPKVQSYAKHKSQVLNHAALKAPYMMYKWTPEERKAICPWALPFLSSPNMRIALAAARLMVKCKEEGKYIEALLAEGKKRVAAGQWQSPFDFPYRDICFGGFFGTDKKASEKLCNANYAFLKSIADNEKVPANMRARALDWIVYQRRDEKSYKLLKKYRKHKVPQIAEVAKKGMEMLERSYLKKKKK